MSTKIQNSGIMVTFYEGCSIEEVKIIISDCGGMIISSDNWKISNVIIIDTSLNYKKTAEKLNLNPKVRNTRILN